MTEALDELPQQPESQKSFESVISELHVARETFFDAARAYGRRPLEGQYDTTVDMAEELTSAFRASVRFVFETSDSSDLEKARIVASLYHEDDAKRVETFEKIAPKTTFALEPETREETIEGYLEILEDEDMRDGFPYLVISNHEANMTIAMNKLFESCAKTWRGRALDLGRLVGLHSFDVAKTAAGAGLAIWFSRRM